MSNFKQNQKVSIRLFIKGKTQVHFLRSSTLGFQLNSNTLNLNILGKDNIVCVSLVNTTMFFNSIGKPNIPKETVPKFYPFFNMYTRI